MTEEAFATCQPANQSSPSGLRKLGVVNACMVRHLALGYGSQRLTRNQRDSFPHRCHGRAW